MQAGPADLKPGLMAMKGISKGSPQPTKPQSGDSRNRRRRSRVPAAEAVPSSTNGTEQARHATTIATLITSRF